VTARPLRRLLMVLALMAGAMFARGSGHAASRTAAPEEVRVTIDGGRTLAGLLVSRDDSGVRLRVDGSELFVPAGDLLLVEDLPPIEDRYRARRAELKPGDTEMRLSLARWLQARERYALALIEAEFVLGADPAHRPARELASWLRAQLVLENRTRARLAAADDNTDEGSEPERSAPDAEVDRRSNVPRLTDEQINLIRVYELDLRDPPRMRVPRPTIERLLAEHQGHPVLPRNPEGREALMRARPERQVDLLFRVQARELYGEVDVLEDPAPLAMFREEVHGRWLVRACASNGCHGGAEAGRLRLARRYPNRTDTVYTNFLILDRFRLDNGEPMLDFERPEESPLLRAGLHATEVKRLTGREDAWTHPEVPRTRGRRGWRPIFRGPDDTRYEAAVAWIRSLYRPRPAHPVPYDAAWLVPPESSDGPTPDGAGPFGIRSDIEGDEPAGVEPGDGP